HGVELEAILCEQEERCIGHDNVVTLDTLALQIAKQPGRPTCAGLRVTIRRDVHGQLSVWHGARCFGRYDVQGGPLSGGRPNTARATLGSGAPIGAAARSSYPPAGAPPPSSPAGGAARLSGQITCQITPSGQVTCHNPT